MVNDEKPPRRPPNKHTPNGSDVQQRLSAGASTFVPKPREAPETSNSQGRSGDDNRENGRQKERHNANRKRKPRGPPRNRAHEVPADTRTDLGEDVSVTRPLVSQSELEGGGTIRERLQHALASNIYECCICCDTIKRHQPVFEDQQCWAVFHLSCISKWARRFIAPESDAPQSFWRCPACNSENSDLPSTYSCWCSKQLQPEVSKLAPHSCGQTCSKRRNNCPHPCLLACHPGPCPPCTNLGPEQKCFCGKHSSQRRCVETDYTLGAWSCKEPCGEVLPCDEHECTRPCHPGLCGACTIAQDAHCLCGKETKMISCCDKTEPQPGIDSMGREIIGFWRCENKCEKFFDCGHHQCSKSCHTRSTTSSPRCPFSPDRIDTCHCGQSNLADLSVLRSACTDPIPTCGAECSKDLPCGHLCQSLCHAGPCPECPVRLAVSCQCGNTQVSTTCQDSQLGLQPSCDRPCKANLSCGRHICRNKCCSGLRLAQSRLLQRPKGRQAAQAAARYEEIEAEHICTKVCGRPLSCGSHSCGLVCHSGPCSTCLLASFDDLSCHCGRTVIPAPIPCGTRIAACDHPCTRPTSCGHPATPHYCHTDEVECVRCPYLVERSCLCGKALVKNQPCWKAAVSCGQVCDLDLSCGHHRCQKRCHAPGDCDAPCLQPCGELRSGCGHPCTVPCHDGDCPQNASRPCTASVQTTCACGNTKMSVKCNSQEPDPAKQSSRLLKCTDFCAITERNKKLSTALGITPDHKPKVDPAVYAEDTIQYYRDNKIWCSSIEQNFLTFVGSSDKVKNFKPMKADLRKFIHEMAEVYQMRSESFDEEPKRNVQITKTERTVVPAKSLAQSAASRSTTSSNSLEQMDKKKGQAYNAFVLVSLRFGITNEELEQSLAPLMSSTSIRFETVFTEEGEYAFLKPIESGFSTEEIETKLAKLRFGLRQIVMKCDLANTAELCWINKEGQMTYRESKQRGMGSVQRPVPTTATKNTFDALQDISETSSRPENAAKTHE